MARLQCRSGGISVVRSATKQRLTKAKQTGNLGVCFSRCKKLVRIFILATPANAGFSLADFSTLKMEAIRSSETSVQTRATRHHIPEYGIIHSDRRENLKSYIISSLVIFNVTKCKCKWINQPINRDRQEEYWNPCEMRARKHRTIYIGYGMFNNVREEKHLVTCVTHRCVPNWRWHCVRTQGCKYKCQFILRILRKYIFICKNKGSQIVCVEFEGKKCSPIPKQVSGNSDSREFSSITRYS
jgi:hypothetical protein